VSQFAAGCAICGEDLVAARKRLQRRSLPSMPGGGRLPRISGQDALIGGLMIIVAFAAPVIGGVIAGLFAYQAHNDRDFVRRNLCLIGVAVAVVMVCLISFLPGTYNRLLFSIYT
jgi:hypothetical protein